MSSADLSATIERFTGFGAHYDMVRPTAPRALAELLIPMADCTAAPPRVVDLGSGTGLSTRYWATRAQSVIGIEPTDSMREQAAKIGGDGITYRCGYSFDTGLPDASADLVVCGQALHWMDPVPTFAEAVRILRPGGVFAAYDYDWPPATLHWEVDQAYQQCVDLARRLEREHGIAQKVAQWNKEGHLGRMQESGCFRFVRECLLHHEDEGGTDRIVGLYFSQGHVQSLLKQGVSEEELQVARLRDAAQKAFGSSVSKWMWSARVRIGVR